MLSMNNAALIALLLIEPIFIVGCQSKPTAVIQTPYPKEITQNLYTMTLPPFPTPQAALTDELKILCPEADTGKCVLLYDYLGKLMVFEKKLKVFREKMLSNNEKKPIKTMKTRPFSLTLHSGKW